MTMRRSRRRLPAALIPSELTPTEHAEAVSLVQWVRFLRPTVPELRLFFSVPNGGHRDKRVAAKLRAEGVEPGVPDYILAVARGRFHGLFVELKRTHGGRLSAEQITMRERLEAQGYRVAVCAGADAARAVVADYLGVAGLVRGAA
jgi:hypothetical protein